MDRKACEKVGRIGVLIGIGWSLAIPAPAQPLRLDDLPATTGNTRFFRDAFEVRHPSLSLNGFSCAALDARGCAYGLGLAEVLHAVYADEPDPAIKEIYEKVLDLAVKDLVIHPTERAQIIENTHRMSARAFVALVTYVLEQNGNDLSALNARTQLDLPTHADALQRFKEGLLEPQVYSVAESLNDDAVKWPSVVTNVARALDLYLALENAYRHYGDPDYDDEGAAGLLSCVEKGAWVAHAAHSMRDYHDLGRKEVVPIPLVRIPRDEVQPGNWPMKVHVALGYAALAQQEHDGHCYPAVRVEYADWLYRALHSAGAPTEQNRTKHWNYQTDNGKRFFAEGPYYFHLTLGEILPFWHAVRLNDALDVHPDFDLDDPFHAAWFTRPLHWLADLVTPDGGLPALDDGNKTDLRDAALMRWTAGYGDEALGRKMAWIADATERGWGVKRDLLLVEMAIPRHAAGAGVPPPATVGNTAAAQTGEDGEQQLVLRRASGGDSVLHYVLLNGESGDAIRRGEGHEQADQMQLLYYVDDVSYLLDSGYDNASGFFNSTWNHYADHNVMMMELHRGNGEGGVKQPRIRIDKRRVVSNHQDVSALYRTTTGRIDVLQAQIELDPDDQLGSGLTSVYRRVVLFIHDPQRPYLIDINAVTGAADSLFAFVMRYHGNADVLSRTPDRDGYALWQDLWASTPDPQRTARRLFLQPFSVEYPLKTSTVADRAREVYNSERDIVRLDIEGGPPGSPSARDHTTVAFIRALLDPGEDPEAARPVAARAHQQAGVPDDEALAWRYYTWWQDSATLDVLAVRSAAVYRQPALRTDEGLLIDAPDRTLTLDFPVDADYGFARLRYDSATEAWRIDPAYRLHLGLRPAQPVAREEPAVPARFRLDQNTPNPFSTTTEIHYALPSAAPVLLVVYDVTGREVARLVDAWQMPGTYRVTWDARRLASGVYLCRLTAGSFTTARQMVLQK